MTDTKLVTVGCSGLIRELGASGPIKHPTEIRMEAIKQMVLFGKVVYEHNPANPSDRVLLTVDNVELDNFAKNEKDDATNGVAQQTAPVVDEKNEAPATPVVPDPIPDPVDPGKDDTTEDEKKDETPVDPVVNTNGETTAPETADDTAAQNQETTETSAPAVDVKKDETPAANATTGKKSSKKNNKK